jgi:hypothetical protein
MDLRRFCEAIGDRITGGKERRRYRSGLSHIGRSWGVAIGDGLRTGGAFGSEDLEMGCSDGGSGFFDARRGAGLRQRRLGGRVSS